MNLPNVAASLQLSLADDAATGFDPLPDGLESFAVLPGSFFDDESLDFIYLDGFADASLSQRCWGIP